MVFKMVPKGIKFALEGLFPLEHQVFYAIVFEIFKINKI